MYDKLKLDKLTAFALSKQAQFTKPYLIFYNYYDAFVHAIRAATTQLQNLDLE